MNIVNAKRQLYSTRQAMRKEFSFVWKYYTGFVLACLFCTLHAQSTTGSLPPSNSTAVTSSPQIATPHATASSLYSGATITSIPPSSTVSIINRTISSSVVTSSPQTATPNATASSLYSGATITSILPSSTVSIINRTISSSVVTSSPQIATPNATTSLLYSGIANTSILPSSTDSVINGTISSSVVTSSPQIATPNATASSVYSGVTNTSIVLSPSGSVMNGTIFSSVVTSSPQIATPNATASLLHSGVTNTSMEPSPLLRSYTTIRYSSTPVQSYIVSTATGNITANMTVIPPSSSGEKTHSLNATQSHFTASTTVMVLLSPSSNVTRFSSYASSSTTALMSNSSVFLNRTMEVAMATLSSSMSANVSSIVSSVSVPKLTNLSSIPNTTMTSYVSVASTLYMNASTGAYTPIGSSVTMLPSSASNSTVHMNTTAASTTSASYTLNINATLSTTLQASTVSSNGSSVLTILPSTAWPTTLTVNYSSTLSNTPIWTHNISSTPSVKYRNLTVSPSLNVTVNRTVLITPNSTMMAMNASSSALPTSAPKETRILTVAANIEIVNEKFTPTLNNTSSRDYQNLSERVNRTFTDMFSTNPDFISVEVVKFSKGSVIVDMKLNFNSTTNITSPQVKSTIAAHNGTNSEKFIFSQKLTVKDQCTSGYCVNGGDCRDNATVGVYCASCLAGYTGTRCNQEVVNGNYSNWSAFSECSKSCNGGKRNKRRTCSNPAPLNGGKDCSSLGPDYEEEDCNPHVCPVIWIIIGVCCAVFLLLLLLVIICCIRRKNKQEQHSSNKDTTSSQMNIVPLEIMVYDDNLPARSSPDGTSNPEFVNKHETEEDDIYKAQLLLFLKQSHLIKPGMKLSYGDDISDTSDYSNRQSRKPSAISEGSDEVDQQKRTIPTTVL